MKGVNEMKLMFASDIHGVLSGCEKMLEAYLRERADKLILLGDLLYHGPRNGVPKGYDPIHVTSLLNSIKEEIICVRGNCDADVDQMVLEFPILADYAFLMVDNTNMFCTHGHIFNQDNLPPLKKGDVLLYGHTHIQSIEHWGLNGKILAINPGSVSLPKEGNPPSYLTFEEGMFTIKSLDGEAIQTELLG